jgi:hypothetical protein
MEIACVAFQSFECQTKPLWRFSNQILLTSGGVVTASRGFSTDAIALRPGLCDCPQKMAWWLRRVLECHHGARRSAR